MRLIPFTTSATARHERTAFKNAPIRARAVAYADRRFTRDDPSWLTCREAFLAGYIHANRLKYADLRVRLMRLLRSK